MNTLAQTFRLVPPLAACLRWAGVFVVTLTVVVVAVVAGTRLLRGAPMPAHWSQGLLPILGLFALLALAMGVFIYLIGWFWGATVTPGGLRARNYWGRRREVPLTAYFAPRAL